MKRSFLGLMFSLAMIAVLAPKITVLPVWSNPATIIVPDDYPKIYEAIDGTDSNGDGIGDTPYIIDVNNTDHYPLMSPYSYWSSPAACDLNRDMKTDMKDVALAATCFGYRTGDPGWDPHADVTGDGILDMRDLVAIARSFGQRYS